LRWSKRSLAGGGDVEFVGGDRGRVIFARGVHEGEVLLECRMEGVVLATYRALVRQICDIPCRFNILNGPVHSQSRSTHQDVDNHMRVANIFLRQLGLRLVLDTNLTVTDGAVASPIPGIFQIAVGAGVTRNVTGNYPQCNQMNYRPDVLNIAYIHSDFIGGGLIGYGMASDFSRNSLPGDQVEDNGTPSTSWIRPSGIPPDTGPGTVRMRVFREDRRRPGHPQLYGLYVTNTSGNPTTEMGILTYGGTIAHEVGHILTLRHRIGAGNDTLSRPLGTNLMHGTNPSTLAQDLDIVQARAVLGCPIVRAPAAAPAPAAAAGPAAAPAAAPAAPAAAPAGPAPAAPGP